MTLTILDTTLRDGALTEDITLTVEDKLRLAPLIDSLGVHYLEGGWPQVEGRDLNFFEQVGDLGLKARITAFGATRRPETVVKRDRGMQLLLETAAPVIHLYGKVWTLHVEKVLGTTRDENLAMLRDSVGLMKEAGREVIYTAEHYFDGFREDREYALANLKAAVESGADIISLGDSNGASLPELIQEGMRAARDTVGSAVLGLHLHDDLGLALANTLAGLGAGAAHVQGTVNGYGARTGITDLCILLPILKLKMGVDVVSDEQLARLSDVARRVAEIVGLGEQMDHHPVVGRKVFAHKTQTHVAAVLSAPQAYEAIEPERVGNTRRLLLPGLTRPTYLQEIARQYGVDLSSDSAANAHILSVLKGLEDQGYTYEDASASLELRLAALTGHATLQLGVERLRLFEVIRGLNQTVVESSLKVRVDGETLYVGAEGREPLEALYLVLIEALRGSPGLREKADGLRLGRARIRNLAPGKVRVTVSFTGTGREWTTVGIDQDVIRAMWTALLDGVEYGISDLRVQTGQDSTDQIRD
ncbi:citramalate synthase [Deinococcus peraridilitoris]|uniref:Citramalate synthase n=1 Tax=Deinococcus peraridilitoris (strain DSM 19664 / LMG 22246 / CIP 109416 / KR-200) TaxID=937777 RepID=K9ZYA4_DEIPD|nr:citramalate synthase [Deinococcus peraridilitoris]AFZ66164.1 isopropylmalate/homocitrate/citramalate synthase [Deinococcus peraridilitoris DSM 19664]